MCRDNILAHHVTTRSSSRVGLVGNFKFKVIPKLCIEFKLILREEKEGGKGRGGKDMPIHALINICVIFLWYTINGYCYFDNVQFG